MCKERLSSSSVPPDNGSIVVSLYGTIVALCSDGTHSPERPLPTPFGPHTPAHHGQHHQEECHPDIDQPGASSAVRGAVDPADIQPIHLVPQPLPAVQLGMGQLLPAGEGDHPQVGEADGGVVVEGQFQLGAGVATAHRDRGQAALRGSAASRGMGYS